MGEEMVNLLATVAARTLTDAHTASAGGVSSGAVAAAAVAAAIALGALIWALTRVTAFEPRWLLSLRHAIAEAGFRASATWAEFSDWAKLGR